MRRSLFITGCAVLCVFTIYAQKESPATISGVSAKRLQRIDTVIQEYISKKWINGAVAVVYKNGAPVYFKAIGYDDLDTKTPLQKDAIFRLASMTKAIVSTGVMLLYEEGKFLPDDPVSMYIPEFKNVKVLDKFNEKDSTYTTIPAKRQVTIRDLLSHIAGIGYPQIGSKEQNAIYSKAGLHMGMTSEDTAFLATKMKILAGLPLFSQPGEKWSYGLNTDLLGYLIEIWSGMPLDQFLKKRIFDPLGMKDTYFYLPGSKYNRLAIQYTQDVTGDLKKATHYIELNGKLFTDFPVSKGNYFSGGGGLCGTAQDYTVFMQMILNKGIYKGVRILSPNTIRLMTVNQIGNIAIGYDDRFGLGFQVTTEKGSTRTPLNPGSLSWAGAFGTSFWIDPSENLTAALFLQILPNSHNEIHDKFKALVYQAIEK